MLMSANLSSYQCLFVHVGESDCNFCGRILHLGGGSTLEECSSFNCNCARAAALSGNIK